MRERTPRTWVIAAGAAWLFSIIVCGDLRAEEGAQAVIAKGRFAGGVVAHVHGADAALLCGVQRECPNMLGQLLVADEGDARRAREALVAAGLHGKITVGQWRGGVLPFIDNFVNLLIVERGDAVPREEILRVLAPEGAAVVGQETIVKPRPATMDDWTHQLYDATGNAVSKDKALRPPLQHLQWVGGPRWSRHHDKMSSVSACVSGDGKVFYIFDEGSTFTPYLPCHWKLIARDAFNGVVLWKQPIDQWIGNLYGLKSGPATLPRRVVVAGKRLCATLGIEAPVSVIDTATGKTLRTIAGTEGAEEIIHEDGMLYLVADTNENKDEFQNGPRMNFIGGKWNIRKKQVLCCDIEAGKVLWSKSFDWVAPSTLSASKGKVYLFDGKQVVALGRETGEVLWKSAELPVWKEMATFYAPKLVVQGGVVMFVGGEDYVPHRGSAAGQVAGMSTENGKVLWKEKHLSGGYQSPGDLLVIGGKMWAANVTSGRKESPTGTGEIVARNPGTGQEEKKYDDIPAYWFHHRCYPAKATEDFLIMSRTGTEFVDLETGEWTLHHWVRGACLYGIMPANGLLYAPQHPCSCYIGAKMYGFTALAPAGSSRLALQPVPDDRRLIAASGAGAAFPGQLGRVEGEWPTYRADVARSGLVTGIGAPNRLRWSVKLPGAPTQPVIADQKVLVADKDNPVLCALAAGTGEPAWRFIPGGRVDSSPAIYKGLVYFGASDGCVYCLDLKDGSLRWKFQAAPAPAQHMYLERMESTHPVHGNVLVMDDRVYTVAGRSMFNDGGIRFLILDALTGRKIKEHIMDDKVPGTGESLQMQHEILNMPMALSDLLSSNGKKIFMRYQPFDLEGNRLDLIFSGKLYGYEAGSYAQHVATTHDPVATKQKGEDAHLFSGTGFLDDSWWHRTYWIYGNYHASGHSGYTQAGAKGAPAGRMITFDKDRIYTWGRLQRYFKWSEEYVFHLHAKNREYEDQWSVMLPILVRAMVASDDRLFLLGPEELMRQDEVKLRITEAEVQRIMAEQEKAMNGGSGSILLAVDKRSGKILSGHRMATAPVLDGMAGAYGNLYVAATDGTLSCIGGEGQGLEALADQKIEELNKDSAPPPPPAPEKGKGKGKKKQQAAPQKAAPASGPPRDADFAKVDGARVFQSALGYRVAAEGKAIGAAVRKLEAPAGGKVTLSCKIQYTSETGPNNGYLAFGDGDGEANLVKCGLRMRKKTAAIIQGPLAKEKGATAPCATEVGRPYELTVAVDLASGDVTLSAGGATVRAKLERPIRAITHVGYCVSGASADFGPVEIAQAR
ncbi:MAG: PQQ-binding-like beta-propeller repeat protein [Verrucomicrobiae bacterium]|nr:PQQ-binding-like beta-propeller repeat protein [Verrucomicrobiae bacterium]